jgi:predicted nucleic acid-binding protein
MANYVIDASVVIEYLITGPYTPQVQIFFNRVSAADQLIVPEFCLLECTNVIWKQVRFNGMSSQDAKQLLSVLRTLKLRRAPMKRLLDHSLEIAMNNMLAVYDAGYIALAIHYSYTLFTLDQPQIRAATAEGARLLPINSFKP